MTAAFEVLAFDALRRVEYTGYRNHSVLERVLTL